MTIVVSVGMGVAQFVSDNCCYWGMGVAEFFSDNCC